MVVQVGAFEASFVPTVKDFSRLDKRFRLPAGAWNKLSTYNDYGFAVFKLKHGALKVHPMAFSFPDAGHRPPLFPQPYISMTVKFILRRILTICFIANRGRTST